jgi:addiction module HigA family antidote
MPKTTSIEYERYTVEFKRLAVALTLHHDILANEVAEHLGIHSVILYRWRMEMRKGEISGKDKIDDIMAETDIFKANRRNKMQKLRRPSHPGEFFKFTILDEREISITTAAKHMGLTRKALSEFVNGKSRCSHSMARRLAEATGTDVSVWIMMQAHLDIWDAENMVIDRDITPFAELFQV